MALEGDIAATSDPAATWFRWFKETPLPGIEVRFAAYGATGIISGEREASYELPEDKYIVLDAGLCLIGEPIQDTVEEPHMAPASLASRSWLSHT